MNIIICKPNYPPYIDTINGKYDEMVTIVGDVLKALPLEHPNIIIMCNANLYDRETKTRECRLNIPGVFLFIGTEKNRLRGLTKNEIEEIFDTIRREDLTVV